MFGVAPLACQPRIGDLGVDPGAAGAKNVQNRMMIIWLKHWMSKLKLLG